VRHPTGTSEEDLAHLRATAKAAEVDISEFVLPESREVALPGMRLHFLDWGGRGNPPVVFLHGGALSARTWDIVCLALRHNHRCIALDQRGHGESAWSPDGAYRVEDHVRDLEGLFAHLRLDRAVLVGHCMGGLHAFAFATTHPDRVAALAVVDVGPTIHLGGAERIQRFVRESYEAPSFEAALRAALAFNPRRDPQLLRKSLRHTFRELPDGRWARKHDPRQWSGMSTQDIVEKATHSWTHFERVTMPVLVLRGTESEVFRRENADDFVRRLPNARALEIPGAGHTPQGDNPRALVAALADFLHEEASRSEARRAIRA
jgi:pimeloyl-ACP methyl ester carboxylesterase